MKTRFGLVFFDVDSTLVDFEGIEFLAGGDPRVVELTQQAMNGEVPLEEVYRLRLELVRPSRARLQELAEEYVRRILPGAREVVKELRESGVDVRLISAGLHPAVVAVARELGLAERAVHAVQIFFEENGDYRDFDRKSPLTRSGGKELVILNQRIRAKGKVAMIGDGVSDLEAKSAVDLFIGFGGVTERTAVKAAADAFVTSLVDVIELLEERS